MRMGRAIITTTTTTTTTKKHTKQGRCMSVARGVTCYIPLIMHQSVLERGQVAVQCPFQSP